MTHKYLTLFLICWQFLQLLPKISLNKRKSMYIIPLDVLAVSDVVGQGVSDRDSRAVAKRAKGRERKERREGKRQDMESAQEMTRDRER